MQKVQSNSAAVVLLSASLGVIFIFAYSLISEVSLPQSVYSAISGLYLVAYAICLYFVFASDRVRGFRLGWTVLLFFFGMFLFPVFWHRHLREPRSLQ
jgi:RsiW-degrading membrane proteinase PrsW (M82 family)